MAVTALVVFFLLTVFAGTASAQECSIDLEAQDELVVAYNDNADQIPGVLRGQLSGQSVDLRIDTSSGERQYAIRTDSEGRIDSFQEGQAADPTVRVETSASTLCSIIDSNDPVTASSAAYENGEITISGVGVVNSIKIEVVKVATRLLFSFL
ncbi:hypothetical protein ACFQJC_06830 [Haloferax namakaokahaiae]|uniref:Uncharacterized protein n=1 Tax=Haloferax namakaokahaiae TaxID=1748331 RepID=A0ABD5ZDD8_9EURY